MRIHFRHRTGCGSARDGSALGATGAVRVRQVQQVRRVRWVPRGRRLIALLLALCAATVTIPAAQAPAAPQDPTPQTIEEFQAAAARIVSETGVPGAGLALVRADGIEWAGGVGLADRERGIPVTGDTRFRVGSVSKTFVAMSLVQLYEEDSLDIEAPLEELVPEIAIENPWHRSDPVRLIHVLQHTAGFDDMHFKDRYIPEGEPEVSLGEALARNPASRRVRWRPGTRMSYSNVGYGVAGLVLEKLAGQPFEDYIQEHIFDPLEMASSSFRLTAEDETLLARGYDGDGEPVGYPRIYLRPAGNLHSDATRSRTLRANAAWLGRNRRSLRHRSRVSRQHGTAADDAGRARRIAQRLWLGHHLDTLAALPCPRSQRRN